MTAPTLLAALDLIPVVELEPYCLATLERAFPAGIGKEGLDEQHAYWQDSLAASGVACLRPVRPANWHVPTPSFTDPATLRAVLHILLRDSGGVESLSDADTIPVLGGGLAIRGPGGEVLTEPGCCSDLGDLSDWRVATTHRSGEWRMVWTGHPLVSVRYEEPWLLLSPPHESDDPIDRWTCRPEQLERALSEAAAELERFAKRLEAVLPLLGFQGEPGPVARRMAGLGD